MPAFRLSPLLLKYHLQPFKPHPVSRPALQVKSMALHLILGQRLDTPRKLRFPGRFLDDIAALVGSVGMEVITRVHKVKGEGPQWGKGLREDIKGGCQSCPMLLGCETMNPICWMSRFIQHLFLEHLLCA